MLGSGRSKTIALLGGAVLVGSVIAAPPAAAMPSVVSQIPLGKLPFTIATSPDGLGPVYVGPNDGNPNPPLLTVDPSTNTLSASTGLGTAVSGFIYAAAGSSTGGIAYASIDNSGVVFRINSSSTVDDSYVTGNRGSSPIKAFDLAVKSTAGVDDTLYVGTDGALLVLNPSTMTLDDSIPTSGNPTLVYVATTGDDSVVMTEFAQDQVRIVNPTNDDSVTVSVPNPQDVAVSADDSWAYVASSNYGVNGSPFLYRVDLNTGAVDDSVTLGTTNATGVAVAPDGTIYVVTDFLGGSLIPVDPRSFEVGPWTLTIPGASGIAARGGLLYVGGGANQSLQVINPSSSPGPGPSPAPVFAPDAPRDVKAVDGDGQATVSWKAPASSGSYPITHYLAKSSPGGKTCLVDAPALTCTVTGLSNGTAYTFTVEALNGAGWSAASAPSAAVTPTAGKAIVITGSRDASDPRLIVVRGTSSGLAGAQAVPFIRLPGQTSYSQGSGARTIGADGRFDWQRKTGKKAYVYFVSGDVKSNTVVISAR